MKTWSAKFLELLSRTLKPPKHELNEIDWKAAISPDKKRLAEHLSAFSNYPGGGCLVYGIDRFGVPRGVDESLISEASNQLSNIGRMAVEPPICIDTAVEEYEGKPLLL